MNTTINCNCNERQLGRLSIGLVTVPGLEVALKGLIISSFKIFKLMYSANIIEILYSK